MRVLLKWYTRKTKKSKVQRPFVTELLLQQGQCLTLFVAAGDLWEIEHCIWGDEAVVWCESQFLMQTHGLLNATFGCQRAQVTVLWHTDCTATSSISGNLKIKCLTLSLCLVIYSNLFFYIILLYVMHSLTFWFGCWWQWPLVKSSIFKCTISTKSEAVYLKYTFILYIESLKCSNFSMRKYSGTFTICACYNILAILILKYIYVRKK